MSIQEKSIDFCKQKAIYENMNRVRRQKRETLNDSNTKKMIGVTMLCDRGNNSTYGVKAQYGCNLDPENPVVEIITNYADTHTRFEVRIKDINPHNATLLEMFALCSYADHKMDKEPGAFGSFRELKNYVNVAGEQQLCHLTQTYFDFVFVKSDWILTVNMMKDEFLEAGIYYQYQSCLHLLDIFDYLYLLQHKELETYKDTKETKTSVVSDKKSVSYDETAESVVEMMKNEWEKYKL